MYPNLKPTDEVTPAADQGSRIGFGLPNMTPVASAAASGGGAAIRPKRAFFLSTQTKVSLVVVVIIMVITGGTFASRQLSKGKSDQPTTAARSLPEQDLDGVTLPVEESSSLKLQGTSDALIVNGDVISQGALKLYGSKFFSNITQGSITADRTLTLPDADGSVCITTNNCQYATSEEVIAFQDQIALLQGEVPTVTAVSQNLTAGSGVSIAGNTLSNSGVLSVNGQTGALNFTAGAGISVNGTTVSGSGVRSIQGSGNVVITDLGNGQYDINDIGAGAATVTLGSAIAQEDTTNNPSINLTKTGSGNFLELSVGATPVQKFVVDQTGAITTGSIGFSQLTGMPSLVNSIGGLGGTVTLGTGVGVAAQSLLNTGVTSINGQTGAITLIGNVGIIVDNGTITNAGVVSITGTANQINTDTNTGSVTLSLPQDIAVTSSPTFAAITVGSATVNGDLTITGSSTGGNKFVVTGGATGSRTITFPDASGTVCLSNNNCNYQAAGSYVTLQLVTPGSQDTGNINLSGTIIAGTQLTSPLLDSPAGLTLAGQSATSLTLGRAGVAANTPGGLATLGGNITTAGGNLDLNTGTITAGLVNGQQISTTSNFTGTLTVAGTTTLTGAVTANTITANDTMTIGNVTQALTLQGTTTSVVSYNGAGTHSTTLTFVSPTADTTYTLQSAATGSYDICTTSGNCAGVGGGVTTAGGTAGQLAKFTGSQGIGDSIIADDGSTVTIAGALSVNTITPTANATIGSSSYNLALQGAGTTISSTNVGITNTLSFATPTGTNKSIVFPDGSGTVCLTNGNCAGAGSGLTGNGTPGRVARFDAGQNLVDASLTDDGTNAVATGNLTIGGLLQTNNLQGNGSLALGLNIQTSLLQGSAITVSQTNGGITNSLVFATASGSNKTLTLPNETGTICTTGSICSGYQAAGTFVNLQASTPGAQQVGNINVSGTIIAGTALSSDGSINSASGLTVGTSLAVLGNGTLGANIGVTGATTLSGNLVANGTATFRPTSNSTSSFIVQNASSGSLFEVDSIKGGLTINGRTISGGTASWSSTTSLPVNTSYHDSVTYNGYVYVLGGTSGSNGGWVAYNTIRYAKVNSDGTLGAWQLNANNFPTNVNSNSAVIYNGYIITTDGGSNIYSAKINTDGSTGAWQTSPYALPASRTGAGVVTANGYLYVIGGTDGSYQSTVYYARINATGTTGPWSTTSSLPGPRAYEGASVANGYVYMVGGYNGSGTFTQTVYYAKLNTDGTLGSWQTGANILPDGRGNARTVVANGYIYLLGGMKSTTQSTVYYAKLNTDGTTGTWQTGLSLPAARQFYGSVLVNGYLYVVAGDSANNAFSTVYYAKIDNPVTKLGGTLDLTSLGTESSLLGNNGSFAGSLQVSGATGLASNLTVGGVTSTNGLYSSGTNTFQSATNSTSFFGVQNAAGSTAFNVDTTNLRVGIGTTAPTTSLDVRGDSLFKNQTDTTTAFQVQKADATALFRVDTTNSSVKVGNQQNPESLAWNTNSNAAPQSLYGAGSVAYNGFVYILGGYNGTAFQTTVYYASQNSTTGALGTWTTNINALPGYAAYTTPVIYGGRMYVLSGAAGNTVYYATINGDGSLGTWTSSPTTLPATLSRAAVVTYGGFLYVIGGDNGTGSVSTIYYSAIAGDGTLGAWSTNANALPAALQSLQAVINNGFIYVTGGSTTTAQSTVYYATVNANGSIGTWTTSANVLPNTRMNHTAIVSNNYLYVIGGFQQGSGAQSTVYYSRLNSDGSNGSWSTNAQSLPTTRELHATALSNSFMYVITGRDASATLASTVYYAKLPTDPSSTSAFQVINSNNTAIFNVDTTNQKISLNGTIGNAITFKNDTNSTSAFSIQSAAGSNLFTVNTTNSKIAFNSSFTGTTGNWLTNSNSLPAVRARTGATVFDGYVYVIGGRDASATTRTVYYAKINSDGTIGAWSSSGNLFPTSLLEVGVVAANGYLYGITGSSNGSAGVTSVYYAKINSDGSIGSWTTNANSVPAGRTGATVVINNGYVYVMGGYLSPTYQTTVYYAKLNADGSVGTWNTNTNALPGARANAASVVLNGYIYIMGGTVSSGTISNTVYYARFNADGSVGAWSTSGNALPSTISAAGGVAMNGYIYVAGGNNLTANTSTIYQAPVNSDGSVGAWATSANSLPDIRGYGSVVKSGSYMYYLGGYSTNNSTAANSTVYYTSVSSTQIGGSLDLTSLNGAGGGDLYTGGITASGTTNLQGQVALNPTTDSATLFQVNNSLGNNLLNVDSSTATINLLAGQSGETGKWQTNANTLPQTLRNLATVTANGYAYAIGGDHGGAAQSTIYYAKLNSDGTTGSWSTNGNALPSGRIRHAAVVANGYIYVIGGSGNNTVYYAKLNADGTTGSWKTNANSLPAARNDASSIVANGYIYVIGGYNGSAQSTVYYAKLNSDGTTGSWSTNANALPSGVSAAGVVSANGYVYILGGDTSSSGSAPLSSVYYAHLNTDGTIGTWTASSNTLPASRSGSTAAAANGYIYVMGGYSSGNQATVYYSKLSSSGAIGSWSTSSNSLPAARAQHGTVVSNGYVYVIAGNSSESNTVFYTSTARILTGGSLDLVGASNGNLAEGGGGLGGSIYAGNGDFLGTLSVRDQATFASSISVDKELAVRGSAFFQNTTDSTSEFTVQNSAGGSLFNIDSTNSNISINANNSGELQAWKTNANTLPAVRQSAGSITANGYVYIIGGLNGTTAQSTVYYAKLNADGSIGAWSTNANALPVVLTQVSAVSANGYVYVIGGANSNFGTAQSTVYYAKLNADGSTGAWQTNANSLPAVRNAETTLVANGYVYVLAGLNGGTAQSTVYYAKLNADGSTGAWSTNTNALPVTLYDVAGVVANGYVYMIGGWGGGFEKTTVYYAKINVDGSLGTWTTNTNALPTGKASAQAVIVNGYVYVMAGFNGTGVTSTYYAKLNANGSIGTWSTSSSALPAGRSNYMAATANGYIYVMGGVLSSAAQSTVYYTSTARILVGGSIDLVGAAATGNLADGGLGGNLTANSGEFLGSLSVRDQANFTSSVSVGGEFVARGSTLFQNSTDSASAFQIQKSDGTALLIADTTNSVIKIGVTAATTPTLSGAALLVSNAEITTTLRVGDATNGIDLSATGISFRGTARPTRRIRLAAEYPGAVFDADGSNNTGTMSTAYDNTSGVKMNYYKWTTASGTAQDYDIVIRVPVPQDFSAWAASNPLSISVYNSDTTANNIQIEITDSAHTTAGTMTDITSGTASTWTSQAPSVLSGTYTAGDSFIIRLRLTAPTGADIRVGNIVLNYLGAN